MFLGIIGAEAGAMALRCLAKGKAWGFCRRANLKWIAEQHGSWCASNHHSSILSPWSLHQNNVLLLLL